MYASRTRSSGSSGEVSRMAAIASPIASNAGIPRCSTTSSHQRSGSSYPAAAASSPIGSTGRRGGLGGPSDSSPSGASRSSASEASGGEGEGDGDGSAGGRIRAPVDRYEYGRSKNRTGTP